MVRSVGYTPDVLLETLYSGSLSEAVMGIAGAKAIGFAGDYYSPDTYHYAVAWSVTGPFLQYLVSPNWTWSEGRGITPTYGYPGNPTPDYVAVGMFQKTGGYGAFYRVLSDSTHVELPGLAGSTDNRANAISEYLTIVGESGTASQMNACVWKGVYGVYQITKLPQIAGAGAGESSEALAINRNGTIVGYGYRAGVKRPCLWAWVDSGYRAYELTALANANGQANDISDNGEIVGTCNNASGAGRGCVWLNGRLYDLNTTIRALGPEVSAPPVTVSTASKINNSGWIVGTVTCDAYAPPGVTAIYIMTP
jgi:probable HAF family extracellular repeat protein